MPELVSTDDKGIKRVNYTRLIPYLIETINEQQQTINFLTTKVEQFEHK